MLFDLLFDLEAGFLGITESGFLEEVVGGWLTCCLISG